MNQRKTFRVRDHGSDEEWHEYEAQDAEEAVEAHHEACGDCDPDYNSGIREFEVEGHGVWQSECEFNPTYWASRKEKAERERDEAVDALRPLALVADLMGQEPPPEGKGEIWVWVQQSSGKPPQGISLRDAHTARALLAKLTGGGDA